MTHKDFDELEVGDRFLIVNPFTQQPDIWTVAEKIEEESTVLVKEHGFDYYDNGSGFMVVEDSDFDW